MFALLLVLLTGTAATVCDGTDMCWSELGDDTAIGDAFGEVCSHMRHDANCDAGCQVSKLSHELNRPSLYDVHVSDP